jgi:uncharacterized membrane protein YphA (DoxX/SURF4 family)
MFEPTLTSNSLPRFNRGQHNSPLHAARARRKASEAMDGLLWIAQIILAVVFVSTGAGKLFAYHRVMGILENRSKGPAGVGRGVATFIGIAEILGAVGVILPASFTPAVLMPDHLLVRLAASGLALIMVLAGIYHLSRREEAAPDVTLFLLAVFVILGRWPR